MANSSSAEPLPLPGEREGAVPYHEELREAINDVASLLRVTDRVVAQILLLIESADGALLAMRRDATTVKVVSAAGTLESFVGLHVLLDQGLLGLAVRTGMVLRCDDSALDPRVNRDAVELTGVVSILCVPLSTVADGSVVLLVTSVQLNAFDDHDEATMQELTEFLRSTVLAASELASITADVLEGHVVADEVDQAQFIQHASETAHFVADVMAPGFADDVETLRRVRAVIRGGGPAIVVQPIVDLGTGQTTSVEALSRFIGYSEPRPDVWFANARRVGLGIELDLSAITCAVELFEILPEELSVSVNVGPKTFLDPSFLATMLGLPGERIIIELTETVAVDDYEQIMKPLKIMRKTGIKLAIDDTGSGYSSLNQIRQLLPDIIKLDRDLTTGIDRDPVRQALATSLVYFASQINATIIAEGIETESEARAVLKLGISHGQGYYFAHPIPVPQFLASAWLAGFPTDWHES